MLYDSKELISRLETGKFDHTLQWLYKSSWSRQTGRYVSLIERKVKEVGEGEGIGLFSAPGRSEIGGNHTDHQQGCVLAAAVTMDIAAAVSPTEHSVIRVLSQGYPLCTVDIARLEPVEGEKNTSAALIRGVAAGFAKRGYRVGGFDAVMESCVPKGSGLSSSAAYEVIIGTILNHLYNDVSVDPLEIARIGQYAENEFFGKPCGLMDQTASSVGGFAAIDFASPAAPVVRRIGCDLTQKGYTICIVNAGGSHAGLTPEYAAIPAEMRSVAACFGKECLREVPPEEFLTRLGELRGRVSDRALLRAIHFFDDNDRAQLEALALEKDDINGFLSLVMSSGASSQTALQNIYPPGDVSERSVSLALEISRILLSGIGAWRVHGGGFAGTIQAFVPNSMVEEYSSRMEGIFGKGCCYLLDVRPVGGYMLEEKKNG